MCFILKENSKPKTAKKDIICWKWLVGYKPRRSSGEVIYASPYQGYRYVKNVITPHIEIAPMLNRFDHMCIYDGYHSYKLKKRANISGWSGDCLCRFIIPKGTRYYENDIEYVSEQIMFVSET